MKQINENLYIGDVSAADNSGKTEDITYMLGVGAQTPGNETMLEKNYYNATLKDNGENPDHEIRRTIELADKLYRQAQKEDTALMIHCGSGISRSVVIAASVIALEEVKRVPQITGRLRKVYPAANPHDKLLGQANRITAEIYKQ